MFEFWKLVIILTVLYAVSEDYLLVFWALVSLPILLIYGLHRWARTTYKTAEPSQMLVFITGASSGLGKSAANHLSNSGMKVVCGVRKDEDGRKLVEENSKLSYVVVDVNKHEEVCKAAEELERIWKQGSPQNLFHLINNAGVSKNEPLEVQNLGDVEWVFRTNVLSQLDMAQQFLPLIRKTQGRMLFISSLSGHVSIPFSGSYQMSKFALETMVDTLRRELAPWNIFCGCIEPGYVPTEIQKKGVSHSKEIYERLKSDDRGKLYSDFYTEENVLKREQAKKFIPATVISEAIFHALTDPRPEPHNFRGSDTWKVLIVTKLPGAVLDFLSSILYWPAKYKVGKD